VEKYEYRPIDRPPPLSKRKDGCLVEAMFAYSSKGVVDGQGRVMISGEGGPCKKRDDVSGCMVGEVLINTAKERRLTIPQRFLGR
jgi:hypothetical protein